MRIGRSVLMRLVYGQLENIFWAQFALVGELVATNRLLPVGGDASCHSPLT